MKMAISQKTGDMEGYYILEQNKDGSLIVKVPYLKTDEEGNDFIEHNIVEANGHKADVIKQFFLEDSTTIIRDDTAYVLDEIIFDQVDLPKQIEPEERQD